MRAGQREESTGHARMAQLLPKVRARRQTQQPDATNSLGAETFAQDGLARSRLLRPGDLGTIECLLNLVKNRFFQTAAKSGSYDGRIDVDFLQIGSEQR